METQLCVHCSTRMVPKENGTCVSCGKLLDEPAQQIEPVEAEKPLFENLRHRDVTEWALGLAAVVLLGFIVNSAIEILYSRDNGLTGLDVATQAIFLLVAIAATAGIVFLVRKNRQSDGALVRSIFLRAVKIAPYCAVATTACEILGAFLPTPDERFNIRLVGRLTLVFAMVYILFADSASES